MNRIFTVCLFMLILTVLTPQRTSAQWGMGSFFGGNPTRLMIGYTALIPLAGDDRFAVHMPPSAILRLPSFVLETDYVVSDNESVAISLTSGAGISPYGFRFKYATDSVYYYRESNWTIRLGLGVTLYDLVSADGKYPMSFFLMGFLGTPFIAAASWNNDQNIMVGVDIMSAFRYGLSTRIHFYLYDGLYFGLSAFHATDIQFGESVFLRENLSYRSFNQMLGISFQLNP